MATPSATATPPAVQPAASAHSSDESSFGATVDVASADQLRNYITGLTAEIQCARAVVAAFELAAAHDSFERPALYWPDLMQALGRVLPHNAQFQEQTDAVMEIVNGLRLAAKPQRRAAVAAGAVKR